MTTTETKTYANRSNARRAAKAAGLDLSTLAFVQLTESQWYWTPVVTTFADGSQLVSYSDVWTNEPESEPVKIAAVMRDEPVNLPAVPAPATAETVTTPKHKEFSRYDRSAVLSPVQFVRAFLDAEGRGLTRKEALYRLAQAGVNYATARTQYQRWFAKQK